MSKSCFSLNWFKLELIYFAQNSDAGMADTSSHLIGDLIPRITDHVFTFVIVLVIVIAGEYGRRNYSV